MSVMLRWIRILWRGLRGRRYRTTTKLLTAVGKPPVCFITYTVEPPTVLPQVGDKFGNLGHVISVAVEDVSGF